MAINPYNFLHTKDRKKENLTLRFVGGNLVLTLCFSQEHQNLDSSAIIALMIPTFAILGLAAKLPNPYGWIKALSGIDICSCSRKKGLTLLYPCTAIRENVLWLPRLPRLPLLPRLPELPTPTTRLPAATPILVRSRDRYSRVDEAFSHLDPEPLLQKHPYTPSEHCQK